MESELGQAHDHLVDRGDVAGEGVTESLNIGRDGRPTSEVFREDLDFSLSRDGRGEEVPEHGLGANLFRALPLGEGLLELGESLAVIPHTSRALSRHLPEHAVEAAHATHDASDSHIL